MQDRATLINKIIDLLYEVLKTKLHNFYHYASFFPKDYTSSDKTIFGYICLSFNNDVKLIISRYTQGNNFTMKYCVFIENENYDFVEYLTELDSRTAVKFFQNDDVEYVSQENLEKALKHLEVLIQKV